MPRRAPVAALLAMAFIAAACGQPIVVPTPTPPTPTAAPTAALTKLTVGLGYIPSVQFAPFYYAQSAGYYRDAGLDVTFENKIDPDLVALVGQGSIQIGVADGTSVIPAVGEGIPIKYIATIYGTYPSIVFAKASSGIKSAADLKGSKLGIPGKYGSSWIMLQALLKSAGLAPDDLTIVDYPDFGQGVALQAGAVDAATGFANNEPVQLQLTGEQPVVLHVDDVIALPGPGLIAGQKVLDEQPDAVTGFVIATIRAMTEIAAEPEIGLAAAFDAVPELTTQQETQAAILDATIATWSPPGGGGRFGTIDREGWAASVEFLYEIGIATRVVPVDDLVDGTHLPQG
jgi:NitT/TauT family transport system substrate-binding protein